MGREKNTDDENPTESEKASDTPKGGRPGPVDGGGGGGMATRENAPEIADDSA
ncbi:hypothetical protein [Rhodococcus sp. SBT000017]|uniref:hypothetical protein n=1 Tax=unclassified Rhodococcus (in: high G+C Gram-positive bacteria) TaxID=192944 RepID=UPI001604A1E6|nr:hypothetical protein [Rhodococcus sp. SBT000017]MDZ7933160.1 hypothetical protein [Rhodococcus sp. (in: high G+C Gram-positive bacteria)]